MIFNDNKLQMGIGQINVFAKNVSKMAALLYSKRES